MRRVSYGLALVLLLMGTGGTALAGFFHSGESLICSDCHTMHYSQSHGYNPDGTGFFTPLAPGGPFEYLLRAEINDLCLSCHDGTSFAPDVFENNTGSTVRQAGALNEVGGNALYPPPTGHTLGSPDEAPGSDAPWSNPDGLACVDCHAAHGGGLAVDDPYRNLGGFGTAVGASTQISFARSSNDLTRDVFVETTGGVMDKYAITNVWFNEPDQTASAMADFCKGCHTDFHGAVGGAEIGGAGTPPEEFVRHPAAGVDIGALGGGHSSIAVFTGHTNQVKVMDPNGKPAGGRWDDPGTQTQLTPTCISCHKGHGNQNAFGLIYMNDTGAITEQGTATGAYRDLCKQCHVQGG